MSEEKTKKEEKALSDESLEDVTGGSFWDFVKEYYGIQKPGDPKGEQPGMQIEQPGTPTNVH